MLYHRLIRRTVPLVVAAGLTAACTSIAHAAEPPVGLGTSAPFAVLAGSTVTNTGPSVINGDLGLSPGTAVSGFGGAGNGTVNGTFHIADAVAREAKADLDIAYSDAAGRPPSAALPPDLTSAGTLGPGVYRASSALLLTGPVTLDAAGDPNAVFIFQVGSQLTTASASTVNLVNGAQACNVFWQIGSSATLGSNSTFVGTLLADQSISVNDGVSVRGRTLARVGAVALINDTITRASCATPPPPDPGPTPPPSPDPTPDPPSAAAGSAVPTVVRPAAAPARRATAALTVTSRRATVTGRQIARVIFLLDGRGIRQDVRPSFDAPLRAGPGRHLVTVRVTFTDGSEPIIIRRRVIIRAAQAPGPRPTPSRAPKTPGGFTG